MTRPSTCAAALAALAVLGVHVTVAAQTRSADADCLAAHGVPSEDIEDIDEDETTTCRTLGTTALFAHIELTPSDTEASTEIELVLTSPTATQTIAIQAALVAGGWAPVVVEQAAVSLAPIDERYVRVSVVTGHGGDDYTVMEVIVVIDLSELSPVWVGPGDLATNAMDVCLTSRTVSIAHRGRRLVVRSRSSRRLLDQPLDADLLRSLRARCTRPPPLRLDVPLE